MGNTQKKLYKFKILDRNKKNKFSEQIKKDPAIVIILRGWGYINTVSKERIEFHTGSIFFISPEWDSYETVTGVECFIIYLSSQLNVCEQLSLERLALLAPKDDQPIILECVEPIKKFIEKVYSYHNHYIINEEIHELLASEFLFLIRGFYLPETNAVFLKPLLKTHTNIRAKLDDIYQHGMTVEELQKASGMTEEDLDTFFKEKLNMTPHQWIQNKRKESLRKLLTENKLSIDEICSKLGFQNRQQMITFCRYHLGYTPQHYRNIKKQEKKNEG